MSYGQGRNQAFTISMFGDVRLRLGHITRSQRNLILKPLVVSLLAIALDQGVPDFIVHLITPGSLSQIGLYTLKMKLMLIPILCLVRYLLEKKHVIIPFHTYHVPNVDVPIVQQPTTNQGEHGDQVEPSIPIDDTVIDGITLRRSQRVRRLAISDYYMVYLQEHEYDGYDAYDLVTYQEVIHCPQFPS